MHTTFAWRDVNGMITINRESVSNFKSVKSGGERDNHALERDIEEIIHFVGIILCFRGHFAVKPLHHHMELGVG